MTTAPPPDPSDGTLKASAIGAKLTTTLAIRQFFLLFVIATLLLISLYFYNFYNVYTWEDFWALPLVSFKYITLPLIIVVVYGYVYIWGGMFAFVPSERSFQIFFYGILAAIIAASYDHSVLDWLLRTAVRLDLTVPNPVSLFKVAVTTGILSTLVFMHYNILSDDFTKRMVRRGIPTNEIARIRASMMSVLVPILFAAAAIATGMALVGEFSALVFQNHALIPKVEIMLLGILGVAVAFVLRSIVKELYHAGGDDDADERARQQSAAREEGGGRSP